MRMACCCVVSCFSSSLYGVGLAGGRDGTVCLSRYCSDRSFQISPRCCLGTPVGHDREKRESGDGAQNRRRVEIEGLLRRFLLAEDK